MQGRMGSVVLVVVGVVLLLHNLGFVDFRSIGWVIRTWWPAILIAVGAMGLFGRGRKG